MTREEICKHLGWMTLPKTSERLGTTQHSDLLDRIEKIVGAAVLAEREACAVLAEKFGVHPALNVYNGGPDWYKHGKEIAAAIRLRGQE